MKILKYITLICCTFLLFSCTSATFKNGKSTSVKDNNKSLITIEDLLLDDLPIKMEIIELSKDNIYEKCDKIYAEIIISYNNGDLKISRVLFDILIEELELMHLEEKVSDEVMLKKFSTYRHKKNTHNSNDLKIKDIYDNLYSEDFALIQSKANKTVIESIDRKQNIKLNNKEYLYLKNKITAIFNKRKINIPNKVFLKKVYEAYDDYLEDRVNLKEIYFRFKKYDEFLSSILKKEHIDVIFKYVPGVMTSFYNGRNNGGIWRINNNRKIRKIRDDIGASTCIVVKQLKKNKKKNKSLTQIAAIVSNRKYDLENKKFNLKNIKTDEFAQFLALTVILNNPKDHNLKLTGKLTTHSTKYTKSYNNFLKNPAKYVKSTPSKKKKRTSSSKSIKIKYIIQSGDYLAKVAKLFHCRVKDIKYWNPRSTKKNKLYRGRPLFIKSSKFTKYKTRSGDTMGKITKKFKMTISNFMKINGLKSKKVYRNRTYYVAR